jgi:DNA replication and repair protein RecF
MYLQSVRLVDFRSYIDSLIQFNDGLNIIVGDNGIGKTNIAEAIFYFSSSSSFRTGNRKELVRRSCQSASITQTVAVGTKTVSSVRTVPLSQEDEPIIKSTAFSPEIVNIISGEPESRRNFVDNIIRQYDSNYYQVLLKFKRLVKQRAELVKRSCTPEMLSLWNERYAQYSQNISTKRQLLINQISPRARVIYQFLTQSDDVLTTEFVTIPNVISAQRIEQELRNNFAKELQHGYTTVGAKSDDIKISLNTNLAKECASYGEKWTIALSLVLAVYETLRDNSQKYYNTCPLLILDDVFSGIDAKRSERLFQLVESYNQVIITSADTKKLPKLAEYNRIKLDFQQTKVW